MIIDLTKHRPGTPESVLDTVNELVDSGEVESIFCMFRLKDGEIGCTWSDQDQLARRMNLEAFLCLLLCGL
jgi:hypothetical protein